MLHRRDCGLEASTSFCRSPSSNGELFKGRCDTRKHVPQERKQQRQSSARLRCQATEDWVSEMAHNLVVAPEQIVQTGATYLFGISAVAASAFVGIKILLWDYRERRSDDSNRFADLQSPFQGLELSRSSQDLPGVFFNLLRFYNDPFNDEELYLSEEERNAFIDSAFMTDDWSASSDLMGLFMKSIFRRWNALSLAVVVWWLAHNADFSPSITWDLLNRSNDVASDPPTKDWRQPLSSTFLTHDVLEGTALYSLELLLRSRKTVFLLQRLHTLYQSNFSYLYG